MGLKHVQTCLGLHGGSFLGARRSSPYLPHRLSQVWHCGTTERRAVLATAAWTLTTLYGGDLKKTTVSAAEMSRVRRSRQGNTAGSDENEYFRDQRNQRSDPQTSKTAPKLLTRLVRRNIKPDCWKFLYLSILNPPLMKILFLTSFTCL